MKQCIHIIFIILCGYFSVEAQSWQPTEIERCQTVKNFERLLNSDLRLEKRRRAIESHTQRFVAQGENGKVSSEVITIPTVFHIVFNDAMQNVSDEVIYSQLAILNEDFRRLNQDTINTPSLFKGLAADFRVEFCLASVDPNGFMTSGITRTYTNEEAFSSNDRMKFGDSGGRDAWNTEEYLNIWVCNLTSGALGYAQFPGGSRDTDGVVIDYQSFGLSDANIEPFILGRTCTHEVGHWLNLNHIWGDGDCGTDDLVDDTPSASQPNYIGNCVFPAANSCEDQDDYPDMFQNYMDYSDDVCMNLFTQGQMLRARALFEPGGFREKLKISTKCSGQGVAVSCTDGFQNGDEVDVDCGGSICLECPPSYCSYTGNTESEWIEEVSVFTDDLFYVIDYRNYSDNSENGYSDFTSDEILIKTGSSIRLELTPGFSSTQYPEYWNVYIDLNDDKDFDDPGELVYESQETIGTLVTDVIAIPDDIDGKRRMRIAMNYTKFDSSVYGCGKIQYGEVEDYTLSISGCKKPTDLLVNDLGSEKPIISWQKHSEAILYEVRLLSIGKGGIHTIYKVTDQPSIAIDNFDLNDIQQLEIGVRTLCPLGWTGFLFKNIDFSRTRVKGSKSTFTNQLKLFPNPVTDVLSLEYSTGQNANLDYTIYNNLGQQLLSDQVVLQGGRSRITIDHIPSGTYILYVKIDDETIYKAFVKH